MVGMMKEFCVMTYETLWDAKTKESKSCYMNHRVLVGKKEPMDAIKGVIEEKVKGSFVVTENY